MASNFSQAQESLAPYIRSRREVSHIRQVLAAHLDSQLSSDERHTQGPSLSLPHGSTSVKSIPGTVPRLRKEYLRALRANIKARIEYDRVCNAGIVRNGNSAPQDVATGSSYHGTTSRSDYLDGYLDLIKQRQRQERLRILQDYLDKLEQKAAVATSYLDRVSPRLAELSRTPVEISAGSTSAVQVPDHNVLKDLIRSLEQAVLRAKVQLRNKKQQLKLIKKGDLTEGRDNLGSGPGGVQILEALGRTRNELIRWMEEELGKAGDSELKDAPDTHHQPATDSNESIEDQLVLIKAQYVQYVQARKTFIDTIAENVEPIAGNKGIEKKQSDLEDNETETSPLITWVISPYLHDLQLISNEQKSTIQQKSHLTVSLAKQHKETVQLFDRLAHESHLLPAHPLKISRKDHLNLDGIAGKEMPSASHRAHAWTCAAESANSAINESVIASLEEGESAIEHARQMLFALEELLGVPISSTKFVLEEDDIWTSELTAGKLKGNKLSQDSKLAPSAHGDIWATLDGRLGML